jgi:hypothetical protein
VSQPLQLCPNIKQYVYTLQTISEWGFGYSVHFHIWNYNGKVQNLCCWGMGGFNKLWPGMIIATLRILSYNFLFYWSSAMYMHCYETLPVDIRNSTQICHHDRRQGLLHLQTLKLQNFQRYKQTNKPVCKSNCLWRCWRWQSEKVHYCDGKWSGLYQHFETGETIIILQILLGWTV